jgi:hypothetical protein
MIEKLEYHYMIEKLEYWKRSLILLVQSANNDKR